MINKEQKRLIDELLEDLGQSLDISQYQHDLAVQSYRAVGEHLAKEGSILRPYKPEILPQGSFLLGTMIKPIHEDDDLDIDLVCQLTGKPVSWTQYSVKQKVGEQLKSSSIYGKMLDEEGRRCWTIVYAEDSNYHMDVLPCVVDSDYNIILQRAFQASTIEDTGSLAIRITDKERDDYHYEQNHKLWLKSNPFGYGRWFYGQASLDLSRPIVLSKRIEPIPEYQTDKLPLQRVVQILKRHRDIMFEGDENKPISIIITTLAAKVYEGENSILDALQAVTGGMESFIEERYCTETHKYVKWIGNPVNDLENFADKWADNPQKEQNFYRWLRRVRQDIDRILSQTKNGLQQIMFEMEGPFGARDVSRAFKLYGDKQLRLRKDGKLKMAAGTGTLGQEGNVSILQHTNFGGTHRK